MDDNRQRAVMASFYARHWQKRCTGDEPDSRALQRLVFMPAKILELVSIILRWDTCGASGTKPLYL
jgi:hypothetical protein